MTSDQEQLRLLFIDDDAGFARLAARALARHGMRVSHACDGATGVARLDEAEFDAITLDHVMPGMSGPETLDAICAREAPPPVIYVTGADEGRIAVTALKNGAADYIVKDTSPDFFELLARTIAQAIEAQRLRREARAQQAEIRAARDRAELLLKEVHHRVSNSLALVSSLAHLQAQSAGGEAREALLGFQRRVMAIAQVHRRLYTSEDVTMVALDQYLAGLVPLLEESFAGDCHVTGIRLVAEPISFPTDKAISLGVVVSELVANACKYAYPEPPGGDVAITLARLPDGRAELAIADMGVGLGNGADRGGTALGTRIIQSMARAVGAEVIQEQPHQGTRVSLRFAA
ncbi:MAG: response regulator [Sphingomonadaceae bacterium]